MTREAVELARKSLKTDDTILFYSRVDRYSLEQKQAIEEEVLMIVNNFLSLGVVPQIGDRISAFIEDEDENIDFLQVSFLITERTFRDLGIVDFWLEEVQV